MWMKTILENTEIFIKELVFSDNKYSKFTFTGLSYTGRKYEESFIVIKYIFVSILLIMYDIPWTDFYISVLDRNYKFVQGYYRYRSEYLYQILPCFVTKIQTKGWPLIKKIQSKAKNSNYILKFP